MNPISGRYVGQMTAPQFGAIELDLRIDVDSTDGAVRSCNCLSGDFFRLTQIASIGATPHFATRFLYSWRVQNPEIRVGDRLIELTGNLEYWERARSIKTVLVKIPLGDPEAEPAAVTFTRFDGSTSHYHCALTDRCFREISLEVDICRSVAQSDVFPEFRPTEEIESLTVPVALWRAGVRCNFSDESNEVDDDALPDHAWTDAELHHVMTAHFHAHRANASSWPSWNLWALAANRHKDPLTRGVMFDDRTFDRDGHQRQGLAIFRGHPAFGNLDHPASRREYLRVWVHEIGHALNLTHSFDKGRPESLSWMNYPWWYDASNGEGSFWERFRYEFDFEELMHLRHGNLPRVMMGGAPFGSEFHQDLSSPLIGTPVPVELLLRSKPYFSWMEPVRLELRLRNLAELISPRLETSLSLETGQTIVLIRDPSGSIRPFQPLVRRQRDPQWESLCCGDGETTKTRCQERMIWFGRDGFYFAQPGEYEVTAISYQNGFALQSNIQRIRVGYPHSEREEQLAQDVYHPDFGVLVSLGGSRSPLLEGTMAWVHGVATDDHWNTHPIGREARRIYGESRATAFYCGDTGNRIAADLDEALIVTRDVVKYFEQQSDPLLQRRENLSYQQVATKRAECLASKGSMASAVKELKRLQRNLAARGVPETALAAIAEKITDLEAETPKRSLAKSARRKRKK